MAQARRRLVGACAAVAAVRDGVVPAVAGAQARQGVCAGPLALANGSFEDPTSISTFGIIDQGQVPGWSTTEPDGRIELWQSGCDISRGCLAALATARLEDIDAQRRGPGRRDRAEPHVRSSPHTCPAVLSVTLFCASPVCGAGVQVHTNSVERGISRCPYCGDQLVEFAPYDDMPGDDLALDGTVTVFAASLRALHVGSGLIAELVP